MKLMKALVVMLVAAGMIVPAVAIAEDRLSLSGEMRVRGWYDNSEIDDLDFDESETTGDQRLRIGGKIAVAEGVSITFRTDITESTWGTDGAGGFGSGRAGSGQQWDRAHIDLAKGYYHLRAGQQYIGMGKTYAVDMQDNGLSFDIVGDVPVKAFALMSTDNGDSHDGFVYGASVAPMKNIEFFAASQNSSRDLQEEVYVIGANGTFDFDAIKLVAELDYFTGDATSTVDAMGTQVFVDVSTALGAATVGLQGYYAQGDDNDVQYTSVGNGFGGWDPIFDVGTSLSNEQMDLGDNLACDAIGACGGVFDFTGANAGVIGARLYGNTSMGATKLGASIAYLENEEDFNNDLEVESILLAAGLVYPVMDNTTFQVQLQYTDADVEIFGTDVDGEVFQAGTGLFVKF